MEHPNPDVLEFTCVVHLYPDEGDLPAPCDLDDQERRKRRHEENFHENDTKSGKVLKKIKKRK